jgi:hypothetical protein
VLSRIYAAHWAVIPNLGLDLMVTPMLLLLPALVAGRIATAVILLLPVLGVVAYSRASFRSRSYWPLAAGLVATNATVLLGFLNFIAATGFALLLAAFWIARRDRAPLLVVPACALGAVGLFFCHLMGLALFLVLVGAFELEAVWRRPRDAARRILAAATLPVVPLLLYLLSPFAAATGPALWMPPAGKAMQLLTPFIGYAMVPDLLAAGLVVAGIAALALGGRLRMRPHGAIAVAVLLACYFAAPFIAKGTCFLDTRFAVMLGYLLFGATLPVRLPRRAASVLALGVAGLFAWRVATVGLAWHAYQADIDGMRAAIAPVGPGARVYVTSVAPEEARAYWRHAPRSRQLWTGVRLDYHLAGLLVLEHRAFWPFLFADPAQQPLAVLPPYQRLADEADPMLPHRLMRADDPRLCDYDFLLLLDAGGEPDPAGYDPGRLTLLRANDTAALYRIIPPDACPAAPKLSVARQ